MESWLQALLGVLLALVVFVTTSRTGLWFLLVVPAGLMAAILANWIQRMLWEFS